MVSEPRKTEAGLWRQLLDTQVQRNHAASREKIASMTPAPPQQVPALAPAPPRVAGAPPRYAELAARYGETAALRLLQVEARGQLGLPPTAGPKIVERDTSAVNALPAYVKAAIGGGTRQNPIKRHVVHEVDLRPLPRSKLPNFDNFMPRVREAITGRVPGSGDPLVVSIETVAAKMLYFFRTQRTGLMQATYKAIAQAKCCIDTAFLVVRFLEAHGVIGVVGSRVREEETGDFHRGPNVYAFLDGEPEAPPAPAPDAAKVPAAPDAVPVPHWLRRYANAMRLYVRPRGLNTTPQKGDPAPA
jgi:hypothetical protein